MANISISALPTANAIGGEVFVGNQSGTTKALSLSLDTMSDYEKGTFTPTLYGATTAGTTTYTDQDGSYEKIGRLVFLTFRVLWSAATGTGNVRVGGLPFSALSLSGVIRHSLSVSVYGTCTLPTGNTLGGYIQDGTDYIAFINKNNTGAVNFTDLQSEMTGTSSIYASITYLA